MATPCALPEVELRRSRRRSVWKDAASEDSEETVYSPATKHRAAVVDTPPIQAVTPTKEIEAFSGINSYVPFSM